MTPPTHTLKIPFFTSLVRYRSPAAKACGNPQHLCLALAGMLAPCASLMYVWLSRRTAADARACSSPPAAHQCQQVAVAKSITKEHYRGWGTARTCLCVNRLRRSVQIRQTCACSSTCCTRLRRRDPA
eukprot:350561-Chlamydomonas_euryale.AAC.18